MLSNKNASNREWNKNNPKKRACIQARWQKKNWKSTYIREKANGSAQAKWEVKNAIRRGDLVSLSKEVVLCMDCKKSRAIQYDHRDYSKPLEVVPVCGKCNVKRGKGLITKEGVMSPKDKASLDRIHAKFYGKKKADPVAKVVKIKENLKNKINRNLADKGLPIMFVSNDVKVGETLVADTILSRNAMMLEAKAKGIKYFRVLNKEELSKVLDMKKGGASDEQIGVITEAAKVRWQAGWAKNKKVSI